MNKYIIRYKSNILLLAEFYPIPIPIIRYINGLFSFTYSKSKLHLLNIDLFKLFFVHVFQLLIEYLTCPIGQFSHLLRFAFHMVIFFYWTFILMVLSFLHCLKVVHLFLNHPSLIVRPLHVLFSVILTVQRQVTDNISIFQRFILFCFQIVWLDSLF